VICHDPLAHPLGRIEERDLASSVIPVDGSRSEQHIDGHIGKLTTISSTARMRQSSFTVAGSKTIFPSIARRVR
jgi:hypothetical protein